jgi:hypothetical protein
MLQEKKGALGKGVLLGILLGVVGNVLFMLSQSAISMLLAVLLLLASTVVFVWGCWQHALGKGYPGAVGLLGLLGLIGLIILLVLPDKHPELSRQSYSYTPGSSFSSGSEPASGAGGMGSMAPYSPAKLPASPKSPAYLDSADHWSVRALQPE